MCMAIPMQVTAVDGLDAACAAKGVQRVVSLMLLMDLDVRPGDFVVVHGGMAIERITPERAHEAWVLYDEMLAAQDASASGSGPMAQKR